MKAQSSHNSHGTNLVATFIRPNYILLVVQLSSCIASHDGVYVPDQTGPRLREELFEAARHPIDTKQ